MDNAQEVVGGDKPLELCACGKTSGECAGGDGYGRGEYHSPNRCQFSDPVRVPALVLFKLAQFFNWLGRKVPKKTWVPTKTVYSRLTKGLVLK